MSYEGVEERIYRRWKEEELLKPKLKGKVSFDESLQMLINKCMTCPIEEFPANVHRLFWSLPASWRDEQLIQEYLEAIEEYEYRTPVTCCGVPVDPKYIPETVEVGTETDWHLVFNAVLNCCNRHNLLIPVERTEVVTEEE